MKTIQIAIDGPAPVVRVRLQRLSLKILVILISIRALCTVLTYIALKYQLDAGKVEQLLELLDQHPISFGRSETGEQLVL